MSEMVVRKVNARL